MANFKLSRSLPSSVWVGLLLGTVVLSTTACFGTNTRNPDTAAQNQPGTDNPDEATRGTDAANGAEMEDVAGTDDSTASSDPDKTGISDLKETVDAIAPPPPDADADANKTALLALDTAGLKVVNAETGAIRDVAFDIEADLARQIAVAALGDPVETVAASECPAGELTITTWANGLALNTAQSKFVGWGIRPQDDTALTTIAGVGIGTTVKDLKQVHTVDIFDSSLGVEFNVGQMSGLLSSKSDDGVITNLWAGTNCIFR